MAKKITIEGVTEADVGAFFQFLARQAQQKLPPKRIRKKSDHTCYNCGYWWEEGGCCGLYSSYCVNAPWEGREHPYWVPKEE